MRLRPSGQVFCRAGDGGQNERLSRKGRIGKAGPHAPLYFFHIRGKRRLDLNAFIEG